MRQLPQRLASLPVGWVMAFRPNQGRPPVQSAKDELERSGADIFIESDDRLAFGHDLIREALRASSAVPVRRAVDRQAADVLLARGALPVEVAEQLADSAEHGDETAIATLLQAPATPPG